MIITGSTSESKSRQVKSNQSHGLQVIHTGRRARFNSYFTPHVFFCHAATITKELRKRGKRHKKPSAEDQTHAQEHEALDEGPSSGPSWIVPRADSSSEQSNPEAPFGFVDPELKAYFKTVDDQLKEWQQNRDYAEGDEDVDPNESSSSCLVCDSN